jgi:hypothetical protein
VTADCEVYISDSHRERCWAQWISSSEEGIKSVRQEVFSRLRNLALSGVAYQFEVIKTELMKTRVWRANPSFQKWFTTIQLVKAKVRLKWCSSSLTVIFLSRNTELNLVNCAGIENFAL